MACSSCSSWARTAWLRSSAAETAWSMAACFLASPSFTMASAIFWAEWRVIRMASSVARYSSTFSTRTFILLFREAFSWYRVR